MSVPGKVLVLPRPNPGPEAWPEAGISVWWLVPILAAVVVLIVVGVEIRRRSRRGRGAESALVENRGDADVVPSAEREMLMLGLTMRQELIDRLGQGWRAKTTEELGSSAELAEVLGSEKLADLVSFLDRVDQIKFAWMRVDQQPALEMELAEWRPRVFALRDTLSKYKSKANGRGEKNGVSAKSSRPLAFKPRTS